MTVILLFPVGRDAHKRRTYEGIQFPSLAQAARCQDKVKFKQARLLVNGTLYSATSEGFSQALQDTKW